MLEQAPALTRASAEELRGGEWRTAELAHPFGRGLNLELQVPDVAAIAARLRERGHACLLDVHERSYRTGAQQRRVRHRQEEAQEPRHLELEARRSHTCRLRRGKVATPSLLQSYFTYQLSSLSGR